MTRFCTGSSKAALGLALLGAVAFATPATAQQDMENFTLVQIVDGGSDADKNIARAKAVTQVIERILRDFDFSVIRGNRRGALIHGIYDILRQERFQEQRGKWRYTAQVSFSEATNRVLDALAVEDTFATEKFIMVSPTPGHQWYDGSGLADREMARVPRSVEVGCADYLRSCRFQETPNAQSQERVAEAAISLGTDPSTSQLQEFSNLFQAGYVVTVTGAIKFEPYPANSPQARQFQGYLRCAGVQGRFYNRATENVYRFELKHNMSSPRRQVADATIDNVHMPQVSTAESLSFAVERFAQEIGQLIGRNLANRLFKAYYANQPDTVAAQQARSGGGGGGARECPGCGDTIVDGSISVCPACDSPLPGGGGGGGAVQGGGGTPSGPPGSAGGAGRVATPNQRYEVRFVNWSETDADMIMQDLESDPEYKFVSGPDSAGNVKVYKIIYFSPAVVRAFNTALENTGKRMDASVRKNGQVITVTRGGGG